MFPFFMLPGCAGLLPDIAQVVDSIEDTAVVVEVNRDAMVEDTDIEICVRVINKDIPKSKIANE
jgi:hypothetical protein